MYWCTELLASKIFTQTRQWEAEQGGHCYSFILVMSPKAYVLKAWFWVLWTFKRLGQVGGPRITGHVHSKGIMGAIHPCFVS